MEDVMSWICLVNEKPFRLCEKTKICVLYRKVMILGGKKSFNHIFVFILHLIGALLLLSLLIQHQLIYAQVPEGSIITDNLEQIITTTGDLDGESDSYNAIIDEMRYYSENPININLATEEELLELPLLSEILVINLFNYRKRYGKLVSIFELNTIEGFDRAFITQLLPYIRLEDKGTFFHIPDEVFDINAKHQLIIRFKQVVQKQKGYEDFSDTLAGSGKSNYYLGSPQKIWIRYDFRIRNKLRLGITAEKDAGEECFKGSEKRGFDFYSPYLYLAGFGKFEKIVIGDYKLQFGQGLCCWNGCGNLGIHNWTHCFN